jgi:hypothetical protein
MRIKEIAMSQRPENPAGSYVANPNPTEQQRSALIQILKEFPKQLRNVVEGMTAEQIKKKYRNWTVQQIVHHLADSHMQGYTRFKLALTETRPTIKPYDETRWSSLEEPQTTEVQISLNLLEALHTRWVRMLENLHEQDFQQTYYHPQYRTVVSLGEALGVYAWHCRHHLAQIVWLKEESDQAS